MKSSNSIQSNSIRMPGGVMNLMLEYVDKDPVPTSTGPLVTTLFNSIKTRKLNELKALITAIVDGKPDEAKALLDKDASLVLERLEEKDFVTSLSEHKFNLQPYQAALSVDDTQMADLVRSYFKDEKEADRQKDEQQNPKSAIVKAEQKKWDLIFAQLNKLTLAIRDSKAGDLISSDTPDYIVTVKKGCIVEKELHIFWQLLDATKDKVITAGKKPFNPNLLLKAWETYDNDKLYDEYFGGFCFDSRALLFWQKVIGYDGFQRNMPVNYVQAFQNHLGYTVNELKGGEPQKRGTRFKIYNYDNSVSIDFYPLQPRGMYGFNFTLYGCQQSTCTRCSFWGCAGGRHGAGVFRSLYITKTATKYSVDHNPKTIKRLV